MCRAGNREEELLEYKGETIEWIDVPPVHDVRLSSVARSDHWLKLARVNLLQPDKLLSWGPEETAQDVDGTR